MRDILDSVAEWIAEGEQVALATVVQTWGSSPRRTGAKMALTPTGRIAGSVSGGCVEAAVFEEGVKTLRSGTAQLLKYGVSDEAAWQVGLACGGQIEVFVQPLSKELFERQQREIEANRRFALVTIINGPPGQLGEEYLFTKKELEGGQAEGLTGSLQEKAGAALQTAQSKQVVFEWQQATLQVFIEAVTELPTLVIVGGVHIAVALAALAKICGFAVAVIDPRRAFASQERFPGVSQLLRLWPEEALSHLDITGETAFAMLTHDPKIDDPALKLALDSPAFYVGALGSQKTQADRRRRLLEEGLSEEQLARLNGPIGLDLGAETPEEIALAIMAEIVAARRNKGKAGRRPLGQELLPSASS
jgi:xanthine dehydrogenase accessory factor